jgi:hypothetical protein
MTIDRTLPVDDAREIEAWLAFDYSARGDQYSAQKYNW